MLSARRHAQLIAVTRALQGLETIDDPEHGAPPNDDEQLRSITDDDNDTMYDDSHAIQPPNDVVSEGAGTSPMGKGVMWRRESGSCRGLEGLWIAVKYTVVHS